MSGRRPDSARRRVVAVVGWGAVLVVAIALRFHNIAWGAVPFVDEAIYWRVQLLSFIDPDPAKLLTWPIFYPTLYGYVAGASVGVAHLLGFVPRPAMQYLDAVIVARCVSGVAGIGSVLLVGALGRRMESKAAGLAAAALLAVVPIEVTQTH